ncbi:MAG: hypothetical protein CMD16_03390 [Flavobacteriales bacterium]|nr:hypothetical protein [Flavobacteriales bacterium]|tara:strand:- start:23366 stop:23596 length:231 start_codon:yes stop_codon:yes gene_type:complete
MLEKPIKKKKQPNKYLTLTSASLQIGIIIYLGAYLGKYLDARYNLEENWYTIFFVLLAVIVSIYNLIKQLEKINNE